MRRSLQRILVVLPNWYGETLFATPFLRALKQQHPETSIATLGWPQCREMLLHNPCVDLIIDYDERGRHRGLREKWALIKTLRQHQYDTAFILRRSFSRSLGLRLAGIPTRVGFDAAKSGWLLTHRVPPPITMPHKARSYLPLLEAVGLVPPTSVMYEYVVSDTERRQAQEQLRAQGITTDRPLVILHPGANWFHKRWAPERFGTLADRLIDGHHVQLAVTGGPADQALADSIRQSMRHPVTMLVGQTTLRQLGACFEQAQLVVSNDTGVLHLATALRRPIVALYGPTSPALTGPLGDPHRTIVLHHADCCPQIPCYSPDRPVHLGMNAITVDEVYEAACRLLEQEG